MPVFGPLVRKTALARFSRTLSALVRSGVPILESLDIVAETSGNHVVADAVRDTQAAVKRGEPLLARLEEHPVFPPMVVQMMAVGEETGALDEMLDKIADFYDQEVEATVDALTSLIEPLLIVVMGVVRRRHDHLASTCRCSTSSSSSSSARRARAPTRSPARELELA